jgi:alpha-L-fucosidase
VNLIHVTCYTTSLYVVHFKRAHNFGEGQLLEVGAWLGQNGDAIYGTRPWKIYGKGPTRVQAGYGKDKDTKPYSPQDFRFTKKGNNLYAIQMAWSTDGRAVIHALGSAQEAKGLKINDVKLLGSQAKLQYEYALEVRRPNEAPGKCAYALQVAASN